MTTFLLVRHGAHDLLGKRLVGRTPGVRINELGVAQAKWLAERLTHYPVQLVVSSPLERALETASIIAKRLEAPVEIDEEINEIDFGHWTYCRFSDLAADPEWMRFNAFRSSTAPPAGESVLAVQARMLLRLEGLRKRFPDGTIAIVSHGDVIRSTLAHFLGVPLDLFHRIEISPGSLSVMSLENGLPMVRLLNETLLTTSV